MLEYITSKIGEEEVRREMISPDLFDLTPLYYAVTSGSLENVGFCLAAGARPNDDFIAYQSRMADEGNPEDILNHQTEIRLLFTLYGGVDSNRRLPIFIDKLGKPERFSTIDEMQTDLLSLPKVRDERAWIHIPWTNVSWYNGNTDYIHRIQGIILFVRARTTLLYSFLMNLRRCLA